MTNKAFYGVPAIHPSSSRANDHTPVNFNLITSASVWKSSSFVSADVGFQNGWFKIKKIYLTSEITWLWWYSWQHSKNHFLDLTGPGQVYILYRYILTYIAVPTTYVVTTTLQDDHECWIFFDKWLGRPWQNHPSIWLSNDCAKLHSGGPLYKVCCCWGIIKSIKLRRWLKENRVSLGRKL